MSRRLLAFVLAAAPGCCHTCHRDTFVASAPPPSTTRCNSCGSLHPMPPRFQPTPAPGAALPPGPYTPAAPPGADFQGAYAPPGQPDASGLAQAGVRLSAPEPLSAGQPPESANLYKPPQTREPPTASVPPRPEPPASASLDVPGFVVVKPRVANGQKPFPDGIAWLASQGYRTVLHLRRPGDDDGADRRLFEKRGLRFVSLEVSPARLTRETVDAFNRLVSDPNNQPLFVYDREGALAGGLWYLYFRTAERADDQKARAEAARVGFNEEQDAGHRTMWVAVQAYLKDQNP
ncbi:MAG TPA: hypothetical protein VFE78_37100 [Gemmataceae bacterium]|jgi:protein tyrosine phosphatase (PTP) superfamily phosphohydrolase (DUF442 family)|nr:hypothetical protein [Gemmataceae bacterium]